jgi:hypothetical protein
MDAFKKSIGLLEDRFEHKLPAIEFQMRKDLKNKADNDETEKKLD